MKIDNREIKEAGGKNTKWFLGAVITIVIGLIIFIGQWLLEKYIFK